MFQLILLSGLCRNIFQELNIAEPELFVPPEIKQVDDDRNKYCQQTIKKFRMIKIHKPLKVLAGKINKKDASNLRIKTQH